MANDKRFITLARIPRNPGTEQREMEPFNVIVTKYLRLKRGDSVILKPNLTAPWYVPGTCTTKYVLKNMCKVLKDHSCRITICEGDGGNASYSALEAFHGNKLTDMAADYGVNFVSLSLLNRRKITQTVGNKSITFDLPNILIERAFSYFINIPVLKVHVYTLLSLSMKNLWGCIPDPFRIHYHRILHRGIVALWKTIRPDLSIIDGLIAGDGNGPINTEPIPMNLLIAGAEDATIDRVGTSILGVRFERVKHLILAEREHLIQPWKNIELSESIEPFMKRVFRAERRISNWGMIMMSQVPLIQKIAYHSWASAYTNRALRALRKNNIQNELRKYGDPAWGEGCGPSEFVYMGEGRKRNLW